MAVVIIPNFGGMFNKNRTFFKKPHKSVDFDENSYVDGDCRFGYKKESVW